MTKQQQFSRRQFIGTVAVVGGGLMLPPSNAFACFNSFDGYPSTDHFWYRKPPNMPYVDSQNKNMAFSFTDNEIRLSDDNSHAWRFKIFFSDARNITFSHIFNNGEVLFATREKLYLCKKKLESNDEIILKNIDGSAFQSVGNLIKESCKVTLNGTKQGFLDGVIIFNYKKRIIERIPN